MSNIEWKNGAVCYADGEQRYSASYISNKLMCGDLDIDYYGDFQLNEPRQGDYIPKSELGTEQKYNDAVEAFGLFGFDEWAGSSGFGGLESYLYIDNDGEVINGGVHKKRPLTYAQLMAIGKLKRLMNERDKVKDSEKPNSSETDKNLTISANKYEREISDRQGNSAIVDVYDVLKAFEVSCPATQHAVKKLLCSGIRGHKDLSTDLIEAKESIVRAIELNG